MSENRAADANTPKKRPLSARCPLRPLTAVRGVPPYTSRVLDVSRLAKEPQNSEGRQERPRGSEVFKSYSPRPPVKVRKITNKTSPEGQPLETQKHFDADTKYRDDIAYFGRRGVGEYALSLEVDEELTKGLNAVRREFHKPRESPSDARAWIFVDLQGSQIQKIMEETARSARKTRPFDLLANEMQLRGSRMHISLSRGKNDLGNMVGALRYGLGYIKTTEKAKFLTKQDAKVVGSRVHWSILGFHRFDVSDEKGVGNAIQKVLEDLKYNPSGKAVGLKLWKRSTVAGEMEEVRMWPFIKDAGNRKGLGHSELRESLPKKTQVRLKVVRAEFAGEKPVRWGKWINISHIPESDTSKKLSKGHGSEAPLERVEDVEAPLESVQDGSGKP